MWDLWPLGGCGAKSDSVASMRKRYSMSTPDVVNEEGRCERVYVDS